MLLKNINLKDQEINIMGTPITVLWGNIINRFETIQPDMLNEHYRAVKQGQISKAINYDNAKEKVKTPHSNIKSRSIYLQETYLSFLWANIYSIFVIHEEGIQKRMIEGTWNGIIQYEASLLQRAKKLFLWSTSLVDEFSDWDTTLPNPSIYTNDEENFFVEKVNGIFQDAVTFLMFHEYAHLTLGHDKYFNEKTKKEDNTVASLFIELEKDADDIALDIVGKEQISSIVAVVFVITSSLLIEPTQNQTLQIKHPTTDNRLFNIFQKLQFTTKENEFYIKYLSTLYLQMYLIKQKVVDISVLSSAFDTVDDMLSFYLEKLDLFRAKLKMNE